MNNPELEGCDSPENPLTAFWPRKRKPGRPPKISNELLQQNRNELQFILEENWALIGWELQQAATPSDVREALRRIKGVRWRGLEIFSEAYRRETTFPQLEAARKRLQRLSTKVRDAQANWTKRKDSAGLGQSAFGSTFDPQKREELLPICQETEEALAQAKKTFDQLQHRWIQLERALRRREASFGQSELLDFIQSDRYTSSPLSFANAMAGLPALHWRQSMDRCLSFQDGASHGLTYRWFQVVADVMKHPAANPKEAIERIRARLLQAKGLDVKPLNALAENWHFLRCAIEAAFQGERQPEGALPYRIFAEYQRRFGCQSQMDILLAAREAITTAAYLKERSNQTQPKR